MVELHAVMQERAQKSPEEDEPDSVEALRLQGKTIQAISLLAYLFSEKRIRGPFLVLSPLSVTEGWVSELKRFAPKLRTIRYTGDREQRESIRRKIADGVNALRADQRADPRLDFEVLLTTYELAMLDAAFLTRFRWRMCVVDEAQRLKNADSVRGAFSVYLMSCLSNGPQECFGERCIQFVCPSGAGLFCSLPIADSAVRVVCVGWPGCHEQQECGVKARPKGKSRRV
jgi:hypothetical protein